VQEFRMILSSQLRWAFS